MADTCIVCHEPLSKSETVYAGLGHLCCSKQCAAKYLVENVDAHILAEYAVDGCFEEVRTDEIGISECQADTCNWCENDFDKSELTKTDLGMLCDRCIAAIRSRGEEVIVYE